MYTGKLNPNQELLRHTHTLEDLKALSNLTHTYIVGGDKQVHFIRVIYGARKWKKARASLAKLEVTEKGPNPRFVVSSL